MFSAFQAIDGVRDPTVATRCAGARGGGGGGRGGRGFSGDKNGAGAIRHGAAERTAIGGCGGGSGGREEERRRGGGGRR